MVMILTSFLRPREQRKYQVRRLCPYLLSDHCAVWITWKYDAYFCHKNSTLFLLYYITKEVLNIQTRSAAIFKKTALEMRCLIVKSEELSKAVEIFFNFLDSLESNRTADMLRSGRYCLVHLRCKNLIGVTTTFDSRYISNAVNDASLCATGSAT